MYFSPNFSEFFIPFKRDNTNWYLNSVGKKKLMDKTNTKLQDRKRTLTFQQLAN